MKRFTLYLVWLCACALSSAQAADPQTDKEKLSYALGAFFGQTVSRQDMDLDIPAFLQAVEDVLSGAQTRLRGEEMQQILSDYQAREQQQRAAVADRNKQEGARYLAENKQQEGVRTLASGLQYKILKAGAPLIGVQCHPVEPAQANRRIMPIKFAEPCRQWPVQPSGLSSRVNSISSLALASSDGTGFSRSKIKFLRRS